MSNKIVRKRIGEIGRRNGNFLLLNFVASVASSLLTVSPILSNDKDLEQTAAKTSASSIGESASSTLSLLQSVPSSDVSKNRTDLNPIAPKTEVPKRSVAAESTTVKDSQKADSSGSVIDVSRKGRSLPPIEEIHPAKVSSLMMIRTTETIDLGSALALAGVDNPTINIAREAVEIAVAEQLRARALWLPDLRVGGNLHVHRGALQASPGQIRNVDSQSFYFGFGARTLAAESVAFPGVRIFFQVGDAIYEPLAARQRIAARTADQQATRNLILLDVAIKYLELLEAEGNLEITTGAADRINEVIRVTREYAKAGQGRIGDSYRAETRGLFLESERLLAIEQLMAASAQLSQLLNLDPSTTLRSPKGNIQPIILVDSSLGVDALMAQALTRRPELVARSSDIVEGQIHVRQERRRPLLPTVAVGFSAGQFGGGSNLVASSMGNFNGRVDSDVLVYWTLQNFGFGNLARARQADAIVGQRIADRSRTLNMVRREVSEALADVLSAEQRINVAKTQLNIAVEGYDLEIARIRQGEALPIVVLDSYNQLLESQQELLRAIVQFNQAQFRLFVAIGCSPICKPDIVAQLISNELVNVLPSSKEGSSDETVLTKPSIDGSTSDLLASKKGNEK